MLGLPKTTEINKPLAKKALFDKFKPTAADRKRFDDQIRRLAIVAEISPQTVNLVPSEEIPAVYVIAVTLKTPDCDKKNIALLSKLIDQRMVFALQYEDTVRLAVCRAEWVLISESKSISDWKLSLSGLDLGAVWENIIAKVGDIDLTGGKSLDAAIAANERREKLIKQIGALEKRTMNEQQPRRKWEYAEEIKRLQAELERMG